MMRAALLEAGRRTVALGLNHGASGNASVRVENGFLITPSGLACDQLTAADLVLLGMDGAVIDGHRAPSTEWRLHRDVYAARHDVGALVHAHPPFGTALACLREDLPAVHYMIAVTGSDVVRCAPYAPFGTEDLSRVALEALGPSKACLLANHGLVAVGADAEEALRVAIEVESVAEIWWRARLVGMPKVLSGEEMAEVLRRFWGSGVPPGPPLSPGSGGG
jgi:L-fuculose-phosphate aldolase